MAERPVPHVAQYRSLEAIYRRHAVLAFRYAVGLVGAEADAEDALHTVFVRLSRKALHEIADVRTYLLQAVRNECLSRRRRARRRKTLPLVEDVPGRETAIADEVNRALAQLTPDLREVVILRAYEEMT